MMADKNCSKKIFFFAEVNYFPIAIFYDKKEKQKWNKIVIKTVDTFISLAQAAACTNKNI